MKKKLKHIHLTGSALIILGLVGIVLPFVPGWPFIIMGCAVLGQKYALLRFLPKFNKRYHRKIVEYAFIGIILEVLIFTLWIKPQVLL